MNLNTYVRDNTNYLKGRVIAQWDASSFDEDLSAAAAYEEDDSGTYTARLLEFDPDDQQTMVSQWMAAESASGDSAPRFKIVWSSTETTGGVRWQIRLAVVSDGDDPLSPSFSSWQVTDQPHGTSGRRVTAEITASSLSLTADDLLILEIERLAADGADTMDEAARLHHVSLEHG